VHHVGIVLTSKDVASSAHVGSKLVYFVIPAINYLSDEVWITQVPDCEVVSLGIAEPREFEIGAHVPRILLA
jgi:hypothetical protein